MKPRRIYLMARFDRKEEMQGIAEEIERTRSHCEIVSRWCRPGAHTKADTIEEMQDCAREDIEDLIDANFVIAFTELPTAGGGSRGGRHVEWGFVLANNMASGQWPPPVEMHFVGPLESIFYSGTICQQHETLADFWDSAALDD